MLSGTSSKSLSFNKSKKGTSTIRASLQREKFYEKGCVRIGITYLHNSDNTSPRLAQIVSAKLFPFPIISPDVHARVYIARPK